jgi:AcrR family transcriptional regulator
MTPPTKRVRPRKKPIQSRSKQTVEWLLEATTRVFRAEGFDATTNRIAAVAGVSVGTLYEYFPNKDALLYALAERHVSSAEADITTALAAERPLPAWLAGVQAAIVASHRYPSEALQHVGDTRAPELRTRARQLHARVLEALLERARASSRPDPELRGRTAFGLVAHLSSHSVYEIDDAKKRSALQRHLLDLAVAQLGEPRGPGKAR